MYTGEWAGTMLLTEADAGSDVGALTTTAVKNDGRHLFHHRHQDFYLRRRSRHLENIIHPVLARIEGAPKPAPRGFRCFWCPNSGSTTTAASANSTTWSAPALKKKWGFTATAPAP
jgi:alkylation response protein AidB-like acyl-CoA dehydrogenase